MNNRLISLDYANDVFYEFQKAFWDERGKGARFRLTSVGREFYKNNVSAQIQSENLDGIVDEVSKILKQHGILESGAVEIEDQLIRIRMKSCIHRPVEDKFAAIAIEPCSCMPANICAFAITDKLKLPVELAELKLENGYCQALLIVFENNQSAY
jgi:hypothetical protein